MQSLVCILKSRDITLLTNICVVKAMAFPVVMYGCKSWTIKKAERWRTDAFELWFWKRLLRVPWTARRSNQSILNEISPEYSLEGLILKHQYFGHLMERANSLKKDPDAGEDWRQEEKRRMRRGQWRMRWLDDITDSMDISMSMLQRWRTGKLGMLQSMGSQRVRQEWVTEEQEKTSKQQPWHFNIAVLYFRKKKKKALCSDDL